MSERITLDYNNMMAPALNGRGVTPDLFTQYAARFKQAHQEIGSARAAGQIGFFKLPADRDVVRDIRGFADGIGQVYDTVVVLGIGGSIIVGMLMKTPESVMTMSFVFLMPLTFASDIFVQVSTMPGWLQAVVRLNPVTRLASASRALMHGEPARADVIWVLIASTIIVAVAWPIAMRLYHKER